MDPLIVGLVSVVLLIVLMLLGIHVAVGLWVIAIAGLWLTKGFTVMAACVEYSPWYFVAHYELAVLPMFILMGELFSQTGWVEGIFDALKAWIGRIRGGLGMAIMFVGGFVAAATGSPIGSIAMMTRVIYPEMKKAGQDRTWTAGIICTAGPIAEFIPPSDLVVLYGIFTREPIGMLLMAIIGPGIMLTLFLAAQVHLLARFRPAKFPISEERVKFKDKIIRSKGLFSIVILVGIIIGGLYSGVFTPSETGAIGAFVCFIMLIIARRKGFPRRAYEAVWNAVVTMAMFFFIIMGALLFARFFTLSLVTHAMLEVLIAMPVSPYVILALLIIMYLILGCFIGVLGMMALTLPVVHPLIVHLGFDPIWFGVVMIMMIEIGGITPPLGMLVFMVKGLLGDEVELWGIFKASLFFVAAMLLVIVIITILPQISLWLPFSSIGEPVPGPPAW